MKIPRTIKNLLKLSGLIIIKPKDSKFILEIKKKFAHQERSFFYGLVKYIVDSLEAQASPGILEVSLEEVDRINKSDSSRKKLLNLGGGTGQLSDTFSHLGSEVFNLDIAIEKTNENNIKFDLDSSEPLPFEDDFFDIIICQEVIEHLENPYKLFRDVHKILKKNGSFILSTPNITSSRSRLLFMLRGYFHWFTPECLSYHLNPLPWWELKIIAQKTGFRLTELKGNGDYYFKRNRNLSQRRIISKNEGLIFIFQKI